MSADNKYIMFRGPSELRCGPHINSELEIIMVTRGNIDVSLGENTVCAEEGDAVLILPYDPHCFTPHKDAEGRVYMFSFYIAEDFYNTHGIKTICSGKFRISEAAKPYIEHATERAEKNPDEFAAKSLFFPLMSEYLENCTDTARNNRNSLTIRRITDYIHENLQEKITLKSMSTHLGISTSALSKLLKDYTNISFTDFVNNIRLERAVHLLYDCDISVTEAAYLGGFGSIRNFNRIFYNTLGITPSEYKKQKR